MKIDFFDFSGLKGKAIEGVSLTADNIMDLVDMQPVGKTMSVEDAEVMFYETNACLSDDVDAENLRIEKWCNDKGLSLIHI